MDLLCARLCLSPLPLFGVIDNTVVLLLVHLIVNFENCVMVQKHNVLCSDTGGMVLYDVVYCL